MAETTKRGGAGKPALRDLEVLAEKAQYSEPVRSVDAREQTEILATATLTLLEVVWRLRMGPEALEAYGPERVLEEIDARDAALRTLSARAGRLV